VDAIGVDRGGDGRAVVDDDERTRSSGGCRLEIGTSGPLPLRGRAREG
jgi:hypothetical protein